MILNARETETLLHAEETHGASTVGLFGYLLVDENGDNFVDENGDYFITLEMATAQVLHAPETDTLLHAEA